MNSKDFISLFTEHKKMIERYVHYKVSNYADAKDVLQDVSIAAYNNFDKLSDVNNFKSWLIGIASNKCKDYYAVQARIHDIPLDEIEEFYATDSHGITETLLVRDVLELLPDKDKQILYLYYIQGFNQKDIAKMLQIPVGTVKSRMSKAKINFKNLYPHDEYVNNRKGVANMKHNKFPEFMPKFNITKSDKPPFSVVCDEIPGWLMVPRVGEKSSFAFYDDPDGILTGIHTMTCVCEAEIHGISCVKVDVTYEEDNNIKEEHSKYMKLTDTHSSYIAESGFKNGTFYFNSFVDKSWRERYEVGENNIGREINLYPKGLINVNVTDDHKLTISKEETPDIYGRYDVEINGKQYDTIALMEIFDGIMTILYVNDNGRTVLFRRYNRYNWKFDRYKHLWNEKFPDSEQFIINNELYVHWYDCIPEFIL